MAGQQVEEAMCEDVGGAPLWDTLEASFPSGLFPDGLEYAIKGKIRKRLRDFGYRVSFPEGDPWQVVIESFAIGGLERLHRGFGDNPWFWVVAWPSVFGAASADFWPDVGSAAERRAVAYNAAAAHLEAILIRHALGDADAVGMLPASAVRGLRAIGQSALPALPCINLDKLCLPPSGYGGRRGRARSKYVPAIKDDGGDAWAKWKVAHDTPSGGGRRARSARGASKGKAEAQGVDGDGAPAEEEGGEGARQRSQSARRRSASRGRRPRDGVLYAARACREIAPFPDGDSRGYLAPVELGELLEVLFVGEPESDDAPWAYARRARQPADPSWPEAGWLLHEVVPVASAAPRHRGSRAGGAGEATSTEEQDKAATQAVSPGDCGYHVGARSVLREECPGMAEAAEPAGGEALLHGERLQVTALSGHWAKVSTDRGASGWIESRHIALELGQTATA